MVKGDYYSKGFKKNLKKFKDQQYAHYTLKKFFNIQFKAHNGIRKRSKRRK